MDGTGRAVAGGCMQETVLLLEEALRDKLDELKVDHVVAGVFFTGVVLSSGHAGIAFTPISEMPEAVCCPRSAARMPQAGKLAGKRVREFLPWAYDDNVLKAAIGIAALNALSHYLWDAQRVEGCRIVYGVDAVEGIAFNPEDNVALIGALVPYIRLLREKGVTFSILERTPDTLKGDELNFYVPPERSRDALSHASVVIATGATLVNGSLDQILSWTPPESKLILVGPTASMLPHALFQRGVDILGGVRITEPTTAMRIIGEGGSGYHMYGKCAEKMVIMKQD